jgi:hypothetical protein
MTASVRLPNLMESRGARERVGIMDILKAIEREGLMRATVSSANKQESRPEWYKKAVEYMAENRPKCTTSDDYLRLGAQIVLLLIEDSEPNMRNVLQAIKAVFDTLPRKEVVSKRTGKSVNVIDGVYTRSNFRSTAEGVDYRGVYGVASILLHNFTLAEQLRTEYRKLLAGSIVTPSTVTPSLKAELKKLVK